MKSFRKELMMHLPTEWGYVNITPEVQLAIDESGVKEGLVLVNPMHITASVFINDDERGLHKDFEVWLEKLAPHAPISQYKHNLTGEDNADAHLKRQIMGREIRRGGLRSRTASSISEPGSRMGGHPDILWRVRWTPQETSSDQDYRGVT